jgi:hypothetical protein
VTNAERKARLPNWLVIWFCSGLIGIPVAGLIWLVWSHLAGAAILVVACVSVVLSLMEGERRTR